MTGTFDGSGELTLMVSAGAGNAARKDLSAVRREFAESSGIFVVDLLFAVLGSCYAECADFATASSAVTSIVCHGFNLHSKKK